MIRKLKSKKIIVGLLIIIFVAVCLVVLNKFEIINQPSTEMALLRKTERTLNLPKPYQRSEEDKGCYADYKGARHCSRYIFYYYVSDNYWPELKAHLQENKWKYFEPEKVGEASYFKAWNGQLDNPVCLSQRSDDNASSLFISSKTDEDCQYIIETLTQQ